jgi:exopolysaccharide production protein ExoY
MSSHPAMAASPGREFKRQHGIWIVVDLLERAGSLVLLILLTPLIVAVSLAIVALSGRSPLVAHRRAGQFGMPFWTLKFRSMWAGRSSRSVLVEFIVDDSGPSYKGFDDPRVTSKFARFCRRFSIDEVPQLVNVLRGEMSLVAPRPLTESELKKYYGFDAEEVLSVKPGITGLWQVMGRSRLTYQQRREMDLFLVRNRSLKLYLTILVRTIPAVVKGKDGW